MAVSRSSHGGVRLATDVNDGIPASGSPGNQLRRKILDGLDLLALVEGEHGVEKADDEILVLAKHLLERDVRLWIEKPCHSLSFWIRK